MIKTIIFPALHSGGRSAKSSSFEVSSCHTHNRNIPDEGILRHHPAAYALHCESIFYRGADSMIKTIIFPALHSGGRSAKSSSFEVSSCHTHNRNIPDEGILRHHPAAYALHCESIF